MVHGCTFNFIQPVLKELCRSGRVKRRRVSKIESTITGKEGSIRGDNRDPVKRSTGYELYGQNSDHEKTRMDHSAVSRKSY